MEAQSLMANLVDIPNRRVFGVELIWNHGVIGGLKPMGDGPQPGWPFLLPGFIDSHVHIESSMLVPAEFARLAVVHGTVATVSDPHEIANVCGMAGVEYMIENGNTVPFKFNFGAPSCVPATAFETAGATLGVAEVTALLDRPEIKYLSEMMNFPGVLDGDPQVMAKIRAAHQRGKPVDGHAPGLRGVAAQAYADGIANRTAGIAGTDHECFTLEEALDKLDAGMKILIREGSAAKNFEALAPLLQDHASSIMFCSDDKHPDSLAAGHINQLCARAVAKGIDVFHILQAACINPVKHYGLEVGLLQAGDPADFILVQDLIQFEVLKTCIDGVWVAEKGMALFKAPTAGRINHFVGEPMQEKDFRCPVASNAPQPVIEALDGQLITHALFIEPSQADGLYVSDPGRDILKLVVVNRYQKAPVAKAFIKNFGLQQGALASSVAHDSHNIIAVGVDDASICRAINLIIEHQGGISAVSDQDQQVIPLPIAGLMSDEDGYQVATAYTAIDQMAKEMGSGLSAPFMTLSFMALLVIPALKLSDKGLFDGTHFSFIGERPTVQ